MVTNSCIVEEKKWGFPRNGVPFKDALAILVDECGRNVRISNVYGYQPAGVAIRLA